MWIWNHTVPWPKNLPFTVNRALLIIFSFLWISGCAFLPAFVLKSPNTITETSYWCFISVNPTCPETEGDKRVNGLNIRCSLGMFFSITVQRSQGSWDKHTFYHLCLLLCWIRSGEDRQGGHKVSLACSSCNPLNLLLPPTGYSQTLCPLHSHPSQTRAPVNTAWPCDYTRLGTGWGKNQLALLFQQAWITESILPPNLLLPLYSSHSEASLLSHTLGELWLLTHDCFSCSMIGKQLKYIKINLSETLNRTINNRNLACRDTNHDIKNPSSGSQIHTHYTFPNVYRCRGRAGSDNIQVFYWIFFVCLFF